jgi:hypothetical protein
MVTFSGVFCLLLLAATSVTQVFGDQSARSQSDATAFEKQFLAGLGLPRRPTISKTRDRFLQTSVSAEDVSDKFSSKIFGQSSTKKQHTHMHI